MVGVGLIVLHGRLRFDLRGVSAGIAAAGVMAAGIVLAKRWDRPEGAGPATIAGGLVLVPFALAFEGLLPALVATAIGGYTWLSIVGAALSYPPGSTASAGFRWSPWRCSPYRHRPSPRSWSGAS